MNELVSVIITTHGRLSFLKKAVKSVQCQTYDNIEIILVDDCSEDGTQQWASEHLKLFKYIYIPKEQSHGGNYARNIGIKESMGSYVAFLDDDDIWHKDKIEKQYRLINSDKSISFVYCGHNAVYEKKTIPNIPDDKYIGDVSKKVFTAIFCTTSMLLIRKDKLLEVGMFDEELYFWQEYDLVIRLSQIGKVGAVKEILVDILHSSPNSDPSRLSIKIDGWLKAVDYIEKKYSKQISKLSSKDQKEHQLMICFDGANRAIIADDKKKKSYFLKKIFKIDPSLKNFLKWIFLRG